MKGIHPSMSRLSRFSATPLLRAVVLSAFAVAFCLIAARSYDAPGLISRWMRPQEILKENQIVKRSPEGYSKPDDNVCTTKACRDWAKFIKDAMAKNYTKIDPCTDFATYACGGWKDAHELGPGQSDTSTLDDMQEEIDNLLRHVLESPYENKAYPDHDPYTGENATYDRENFEKMKTAYDACMDEEAIKKTGPEPLKRLVSELPALETLHTETGLTDALVWLVKKGGGVTALVGASPDRDARHPEKGAVVIGPGTYMLPSHEYYDNEDSMKNYTKTIAGMFAIYLGGDAKKYHDIARKVIDVEAGIARAEPTPDKAQSVTYNYNPIPLSEADQLVPNISFTNMIKALAPEGWTTDTVTNSSPDFFPQLASLVKNTSLETIHAYFQWELIQTSAYRVDEEHRKPLNTFNNQLNGYPPDTIEERWRTCLAEVDANLPWIESAFFVRYRFNDTAKRIGEEMVQELKDVFASRFDTKYDWMSEAAKNKAKEKLANMIAMIGYPEENPAVLNPADLSKYYADLTVSRGSYWDNGVEYNRWFFNKYWNDLLKPVDRYEWYDGDSAKEVTGYNSPWDNHLVITAGNMQFPWFGTDLPDHVNYGGQAGGTIGHEMTHGFDNDGREYDERGAYRNWWDDATRAEFDKRTKCLVDQYSKYTVPGIDGELIHVNGKQTLTENIADTGGVSLGFEAWQRRKARGAKGIDNRLLPGMEQFTPEQLYFLAYASNYCYKVRPEKQVEWARKDVHAPTDFRIIGPLANSRGFRESFNCPVKEPTCELW